MHVKPRRIRALLAGAGMLLAAGAAHAGPIYSIELDHKDFKQNAAGGKIFGLDASYDAMSGDLRYEYVSQKKNDSFWLVLSTGAQPRGDGKNTDQYAILFGDIMSERLWAYQYDGKNAPTSWNTQPLLAYWEDGTPGLSVDSGPGKGRQTVSININVAQLNAKDPDGNPDTRWEGIQFAENIGIWHHNSTAPIFGSGDRINEYKPNGCVRVQGKRHCGKAGWFDTIGDDGLPTDVTDVPEPATLSMLGLGALLLGARRHRRA